MVRIGRREDQPASVQTEQQRLHAIRVAAEQELGRLRTELARARRCRRAPRAGARRCARQAREREAGTASRRERGSSLARAGRARGTRQELGKREARARPRASGRSSSSRRTSRVGPPERRVDPEERLAQIEAAAEGAPGGREGVRAHAGRAGHGKRRPRAARSRARRARASCRSRCRARLGAGDGPSRAEIAELDEQAAPSRAGDARCDHGALVRRRPASARAARAPRAAAERVAALHFVGSVTYWGVSSAGRAPALQAGGHRFDPGTLHRERPC